MNALQRYATVILFALFALFGAACELRIATDIVVAADHTGELVVSVALDEDTARDLVDAGLVPTAGLDEAVAAAEGWTAEPLDGVAAGVRLRHEFDDPSQVGALLAALSRDLGVEDGALWDGLRLVTAPDGETLVLQGRAGVVAPTVAGAEGAAVSFDGDDLAQRLREDGRAAVRHDLQLVSAGGYGAQDADRQTDGALIWELPTGELRTVSAELLAADRIPWLVFAIVAGVALAGAFALTVALRRRSRRGTVVAV